MKNNFKYKFSVIIPIYNVQKYLEETILSIVNQTIGFKENIQLILVNDGSTDDCEKICLKYKKKFCDNILYIYQENKGVSAARNKGIEVAEGKYINFIDSDDIWDLDVFQKVYNFFELNKNKIDVVACRQKFFEGKEGYHKLDFKFEKNKIVNITKHYEYIQLSTSSAFIKSEVLKKYKYDERLKYSEDATLMGLILMEKSKYGILASAIYNYRKRYDETSALQNREQNKSWYFDTVKYSYEKLIDESIKKYGKLIEYYQYQIMYDIQWRLKVDISQYLNSIEREKYVKSIIDLLNYIDDKIICKQRYLKEEYKTLALCLKYNKDIRKEFREENGKIFFGDFKIFNLKKKSLIKINNIDIEKNDICINGEINCILPENEYSIYLTTLDGRKILLKEEIIENSKPSIIGNINCCKNFSLNTKIKKRKFQCNVIIEYKRKSTQAYINTKKIHLKCNMKTNIIKINKDQINIFKINESNKIKSYSKEHNFKRYITRKSLFKDLIKVKYKILNIKLNKRVASITFIAYINNKYGINIKNKKIYIDDVLYKNIDLKEYQKNISKINILKDFNIYKISFNISDILNDESCINGKLRIALEIGNKEICYKMTKNGEEKNKRYFFSPIKSIYVKDYAMHFRRTKTGKIVLVKRKKENIENETKFKVLENKFISAIFYYTGKLLKNIRKSKINLFYEKFSEKAEEGTFDLFKKVKSSSKSKSYFVIDENSEDYIRIKDEKNVVKKYSLKYYWLIYNANNFISTEAPIHLNILRSNNKYLRRALIDGEFIFLQHGITYLKCQGKESTFSKNKEGEATYVIVGSDKEKKVVKESLELEEKQIIKTGLPIFDKIKYNHINNNSNDIVTIMLTWKPYEEQLYDFKKSSYYQNVIHIYNTLVKYIARDKIKIVAHPKVYKLLNNTDIKNNIWQGKISEILNITKLLITDYSSVCYNAFYQGAGVIFYQEDIEKYEKENGKLIPNQDEYIGYRTFSLEQLEDLVKKSIKNNKINLEIIRNHEFVEKYKLINEFCDGNNIDRIYKELIKLDII